MIGFFIMQLIVKNPEGRVLMLDKIIWKNDWPEVKGQSPSLESERPEV